MSNIEIIVWTAVVLAVFGLLWWQGQIRRLNNYWKEMWVELDKCSWPSWSELKGSTALMIVTIAILGLFTVAVDFFLNMVFIKL